MLRNNQIIKIARDAIVANSSPSVVNRVISEPTSDSEGRDALRITIVVKPNAIAKLTGEATLNTLVRIQEKLREAGEERFPIVEYATEKELQESGDS